MQYVSSDKVIVCESSFGWLLDHRVSLRIKEDPSALVQSITSSNRIYDVHPELFAIEGPYQMDTQYEKKQIQTAAVNKRKKRKRKAELNDGEIALQNYYAKVKGIVHTAYNELLQLGKRCQYFSSASKGQEDHGNNAVAKQTAALLSGIDDELLVECCTAATSSPSSTQKPLLLTDSCKCQQLPINTMVRNESSSVLTLEKDNTYFVIPPKASFLWSDISHVWNLMHGGCFYDVIMLDPPWQNKSVKRMKMYSSLSTDELLHQLPLDGLMAPGCIVAVWVTNKQAQQAFVRDTLFPAFGIAFVAQWYWLKVTVHGEPVCDLDSQHKKPFESVMIGCYEGNGSLIPRDQVLVSVPCVLHSRKPPLHEILEKLHPKARPRCLEMFARNLLPGWTSWGNEVVKFQNLKYFVS